MTEIVFFRNNKKKTNKISQISYFFRLSFWCIGKLDVHQKYSLTQPLFIGIHINIYTYIYVYIYIYIRLGTIFQNSVAQGQLTLEI